MMRLDKFLKVSRIIKRRTLAKEIADQGRVKINGMPAKASTNVVVGDELELTFAHTVLTVKVDAVKDVVRKEDAQTLYHVVKEEKVKE